MFKPYHLLGIEGLGKPDVEAILNLAKDYIQRNRGTDKKHPILTGRTLINLFFENSTRTRTSFELAGKRLGADVINMSVASSATKKGETLIDTAMTLNAMHPEFIAVRHAESGSVHLLAQKVKCHVINAGDGWHEHPTQALLDALTILEAKGSITGLKVVICGDILHSRVARSNILLLTLMGADVHVVAPPTLMPTGMDSFPVTLHYKMDEGVGDADIIMMLRLQQERMASSFIPGIREYFHLYGLDDRRLSLAKPDALVMHPGPINRGVEIDTYIADDINRSVILSQVEMGVAVRQAVLELLGRQE